MKKNSKTMWLITYEKWNREVGWSTRQFTATYKEYIEWNWTRNRMTTRNVEREILKGKV